MESYKHHFERALQGHGNRLHMAAHSHHLWPDVARDAQLKAWDEAATYADLKWDRIFEHTLPAAQNHVARMLNLPDPEQVVFGPNTHSFVVRLLSCLPNDRPIRVLSTDGEFHSFARQARRMAEEPSFELTSIACDPFDSFVDRLIAQLANQRVDMLYLSHVLYETARVVERLDEIVAATDDDTLICIDGYHGFAAVPTDVSAIAGRAFYTAGGYKYAMSGEGCCFLAVPPGCALRPRNTGWFAGFDSLAVGEGQGQTHYRDNGWRFAGATFDPVGLYRFVAVWDHWTALGIDIATIHTHVHRLQQTMLDRLDAAGHPLVHRAALIHNPHATHGHFLSFNTGSSTAAAAIVSALDDVGVTIDSRGSFVRFGFGLYHDQNDIDQLLKRLSETSNKVYV